MIEEDGMFVMDGDTTNFEDGGCGVSNGFGGYNRRHVRSGSAELLPVNSCSQCCIWMLQVCVVVTARTLDDGICDDIDPCIGTDYGPACCPNGSLA